MGPRLLRAYVRSVIREGYRGSKKLRIFDFDDTLVTTGSMIHVTSADGRTFDLTPGEYAVYEPSPGDGFDYSDFSHLIDPKEIKWTNTILRRITAKGSEVVVLTARGSADPVHQFLRDAGIPPLEVVALGSGDPTRKAEYVERRIVRDGFDLVEFFDDSPKNVAAVGALDGRFPGVRVVSRQVVHGRT